MVEEFSGKGVYKDTSTGVSHWGGLIKHICVIHSVLPSYLVEVR